jgi:hypothetical protein
MLSKDMFDDMKEMQAFDWDVRTFFLPRCFQTPRRFFIMLKFDRL